VAYFAFPRSLFPAKDQVADWSRTGSLTAFEEDLRAQALLHYVQESSPDKELTKFIVPLGTWAKQFDYRRADSSSSSSYAPLGNHSWIATVDKAPFIPSHCERLFLQSIAFPRSLVHLVGATCTRLRILYCAESLANIIIDDTDPHELLFVIIEPNVSVVILDKICSMSPASRVILGSIGSGAQVTWISDHKAAALFEHERWSLSSLASLESVQGISSTKQSWLRREFELEDHAHLRYTFLGALGTNEHCALTTVQEHIGPSSTSSVMVKTGGACQSRSFYRGVIKIVPNCIQTVAHQQQRALLLTAGARACAIPSLEVATHEVHCSHGSAVGQLQDGELMYLQSKGLTVDQARALLIEGFFDEKLSKTLYPALSQRLVEAML